VPVKANDAQLAKLRRVWSALGNDDPLWAVLSHADKQGRRWNVEEFLETGRVEVEAQLAELTSEGYPLARQLALDFGCGAGRLTRALAGHFERVIGMDVSASMIATAQKLNADLDSIEFRENASSRLVNMADASVDFVLSRIVLQHIPRALAIGYVAEFFRVLAPGGVAVFQFIGGVDDSLRGRLFGIIPNRWLNPLRRLWWRRRTVFEMHPLPEPDLHDALLRYPWLRLVHATDDSAAGAGWRGRRWTVVNDDVAPQRVDCGEYVLYANPGDAHIGAPLLEGRAHEPHVEDVLRERLRANDVVLDIGANIGIMTMLAASRVGAGGRVIAVEPIAHNRLLISRSAQANRFGQVEILAAAAGEHSGVLQLQTHPTTSNSSTPGAAGERLNLAGGKLVRVPMVVLDEALAMLDRLDLVKIDVAGMEPQVLRGFEHSLARLRPVLLSEFHPWAIERASGSDPIEYLHWLRTLYSSITILHRDGRRECHSEPEAIMQSWQEANGLAGLDGRLHLDLMLEP
jgi:FkbM family methyltransferase